MDWAILICLVVIVYRLECILVELRSEREPKENN
jgi:hypothetical protein